MANALGVLAKAYRNTGNFGTPTWNEVPLFNELTLNRAWDLGDVQSRASRIKRSAPTLMDLSVSGNIRTLAGDEDYEAIKDAMFGGTALDMLFLTGPNNTNSEVGVRFESVVVSLNQDQGAANVMYDEVEFRPHGLTTNAVQKVIITNNAPVYTELGSTA